MATSIQHVLNNFLLCSTETKRNSQSLEWHLVPLFQARFEFRSSEIRFEDCWNLVVIHFHSIFFFYKNVHLLGMSMTTGFQHFSNHLLLYLTETVSFNRKHLEDCWNLVTIHFHSLLLIYLFTKDVNGY